MSQRIVAGAMSGTSADGVDIALVHVSGRGRAMQAELLGHHHRAYPSDLRRRIFQLRQTGATSLRELAVLAHDITRAYVVAFDEAIATAQLPTREIAAIAAHGQTLFHDPPLTLQWLDPALLAAETGCAVVSDFRRADCAAGGQGAPLVPFADDLLFRHPSLHRILLNIGGIANLTSLPPGGSLGSIVAFDTGPGNCISDWICRQQSSSGPGWDQSGAGALRGNVLREIADRFLANEYFNLSPPKSTDGPGMIAGFEQAIGGRKFDPADLLATAAHVTAMSISTAISRFAGNPAGPLELIVSGGGVHNRAIMDMLRAALGERAVLRTTDELGFPAEAKEAVAFALLGAATLDSEPSNVPSVTGARSPVVLGSITPKPISIESGRSTH
jgi:anhydro-N-acetylmuramic acid kinase